MLGVPPARGEVGAEAFEDPLLDSRPEEFPDRLGGPDGRIEENLGAVSIELTAADLRDIDDAASRITVEGARYPEHLERMTGR